MKGLELRLARETLGLSQYEAAEHIGRVHQRSWSFWETGRAQVKPDVAEFMRKLINRRHEVIRQFANSQTAGDAKKVVIVYYNSPEHCQSFIDWKFSQSLARTLAIDFGATLVEFDKQSFDEFCQGFGLPDTPATRSEWAVYQHSSQSPK
ncbi:TPA: helix-turn-helix domain-containing protein [Mannheimia haemolytica]